jgi:hypothetical protein
MQGIVDKTTRSAEDLFMTSSDLVNKINATAHDLTVDVAIRREKVTALAKEYWEGIDPTKYDKNIHKNVEVLIPNESVTPDKSWFVVRGKKGGVLANKQTPSIPIEEEEGLLRAKRGAYTARKQAAIHRQAQEQLAQATDSPGSRHLQKTGKIVQ